MRKCLDSCARHFVPKVSLYELSKRQRQQRQLGRPAPQPNVRSAQDVMRWVDRSSRRPPPSPLPPPQNPSSQLQIAPPPHLGISAVSYYISRNKDGHGGDRKRQGSNTPPKDKDKWKDKNNTGTFISSHANRSISTDGGGYVNNIDYGNNMRNGKRPRPHY